MNIGGSAGHSSFLALDIDEGPPPAVQFGDDDAESPSPDEADFEENSPAEIGRKWATKVRPVSEIKSSGRRKQTTEKKSATGAPTISELKRVVEVLKTTRRLTVAFAGLLDFCQ